MNATLTQLDPFTNIPYAELPVSTEAGSQSAQGASSAFLSDILTLQVGQGGNNVFRADSSGIWLGANTFALAPFSVSMAGAVTATSMTLVGGTIRYGKTSFTDSVNAGYFISALGFYFGSASDATKVKYTLADGSLDHIGTISGRSTAIIAAAISDVGHFIDTNLDTNTKQILGDFTFGASGAIQIGTYVNGVLGDIRVAPTGIVARNSSGANTFALNGTTGAATFAGTLSAPDGNIGGWTISATRLYAGSGSTAAGMATDGTIRFFAGDSTPASAPFFVESDGDTRVIVLTNKSILFETITAPTASDGQLWCAVNAANKKVLWGYFGGDTTNKQQVSMSRMFAQATRDNDNTGGGSTLTYDVEISTWFQPRSVEAKGFLHDADSSLIGVCYGFAQNGMDGVNTGLAFNAVAKSNIVSDLSYGSDSGFVHAHNLSTNAAPKIPAGIDGTLHITSYYDNSNNAIIGTDWSGITGLTSLSWTNNSFYVLDMWRVWQQGDCILSSNYDASARANLDAYAYVLSWTDTKVTIRVVSKVGYRLFCQFNVIG